MSAPDPQPSLPRRSFMGRLGAGLAAFGGACALAPHAAGAQPSPPKGWQPARHAQDDWYDAIPGKHRFFFDATSPRGVGEAITFASNFYVASKSGYGLADADNAVVISLRHWATPFAFADAMWAKYGAPIGERIQFKDPKTGETPVINVYQVKGYGSQLPNREVTLSAMAERGVHFSICDMATRVYAGLAAARLGLKQDAVYDEIRAAALPNTHFSPAGIVAVNRAQERGYAIQYIG